MRNTLSSLLLSVMIGLAALFMGIAVFPNRAVAAMSISVVAPTGTVATGAVFPVAVILNADQPVNAYVIKLGVGSGVLYKGANNADSIITVWQDFPELVNGVVTVKGGSFTPFTGSNGKLMTLNFEAVSTGTVRFAVDGSSVYLANGKGTKVVPVYGNGAVALVDPTTPGAKTFPTIAGASIKDTTAPLITYLATFSDPFNPGRTLLGFSAKDDISGIASMEFRYKTGWWWSDWQPARNPVSLPVAAWAAALRVTDNSGNTSEAEVYNWFIFAQFCAAVAVIAAFAIGLVRFLVSARRFKRQT